MFLLVMPPSLLFGEPSRAFCQPSRALGFSKPSLKFWEGLNAFLSFPLSKLSKLPFWERKGPFPVANFSFFRKGSFPGKGTVPKIAETFPSCRGSFPGKGKDLSQLQPFLGKDLSLKWVQNNYSLEKLMVG